MNRRKFIQIAIALLAGMPFVSRMFGRQEEVLTKDEEIRQMLDSLFEEYKSRHAKEYYQIRWKIQMKPVRPELGYNIILKDLP